MVFAGMFMNNTKPVSTSYAEFEAWFLDNDQNKGARGLSEMDVVKITALGGTTIPDDNVEVTAYGNYSSLDHLTNDATNIGNGTRWARTNNPEKYLKAFSVRITDVPGVTSLEHIEEVQIQQEKPAFSVQMGITKPTPFAYDYFHTTSGYSLSTVDVYENGSIDSSNPDHDIPTALVPYLISYVVDSQYGHSNTSNNGEWYIFPISV